jgi:hypothetical protein
MIFVVLVAAILEIMMYNDLFNAMDALANPNTSSTIALILAIFGAILCVPFARAIKHKYTHKELTQDISGTSQYDKFTPYQKQVFDNSTNNHMLKVTSIPLGIICLIIPFARWLTLLDTLSVSDKFLSVAIASAISYFIFAVVIVLEIYFHCIWTQKLDHTYNVHKNKVALHGKITEEANKIGKDLIQISLAEREAFKAFMSNKNYQLLNENTVDSQLQIDTFNQSQPTSSTNGDLLDILYNEGSS